MPYDTQEKERVFQRGWHARRRRVFFADKACERCGVTGVDLELHHREPDQKVTSNVWSWATERREAEIAKCDILCHHCHRAAQAILIRAEAERRNPCGTHGAWQRGCRCAPCRDARNAWKRRRNLERRKAESTLRAGVDFGADVARPPSPKVAA